MSDTETTGYTAFRLAGMADCASPDTSESAGARFLLEIQDAVNDRAPEGGTDDITDIAHEIADAAVPIMTYEVWQTFVDLAAWQEDPTELGGDGSDMEQSAKVCLYMIGERLAASLLSELDNNEHDDE